MQLATVQIKLSGNPMNTVMKHEVTPAQLAVIAMMHGEDCVQSMSAVTQEDRSIGEEMDRLKDIFNSDHSAKILSSLFPGLHPQLPQTFADIGYDVEVLKQEPTVYRRRGETDPSAAGKKIAEKIAAETQRKLKQRNIDLGPDPQDMSGDMLDEEMEDDETEGDEEDVVVEAVKELPKKVLKDIPPKKAKKAGKK